VTLIELISPSLEYIQDTLHQTEEHIRLHHQEIHNMEQKIRQRKSQVPPTDSIHLMHELTQQFKTIEQVAVEIHSELTDLHFLTRKFQDIYHTDFSNWISKDKQRLISTTELRDVQNSVAIGESGRRMLTNLQNLKSLLSSLQVIREIYLQIVSDEDNSHARQLELILCDSKFGEHRVNRLIEYSKVLQESITLRNRQFQ
jgi:hypothetical protein